MTALPEQIADMICRIAPAQISVAALVEGTPLTQAGMDSFALVDLVLEIEQQFGISLKPEDWSEQVFATTHSLASCVERHIQAGG